MLFLQRKFSVVLKEVQMYFRTTGVLLDYMCTSELQVLLRTTGVLPDHKCTPRLQVYSRTKGVLPDYRSIPRLQVYFRTTGEPSDYRCTPRLQVYFGVQVRSNFLRVFMCNCLHFIHILPKCGLLGTEAYK